LPIPNGDDRIAGHMPAATAVQKLAGIETADVADLVEGKFLASLDKLRWAEVERILEQYKAWLSEDRSEGREAGPRRLRLVKKGPGAPLRVRRTAPHRSHGLLILSA
jgi:hypothetical protein